MSVLLALVFGSAAFAAGRVLVGRRDVAQMGRLVQAHVQVGPRAHEAYSQAESSGLRRRLDALERWASRRSWWPTVVLRVERAGVSRKPVDVAAALLAVSVALFVLLVAAGSTFLGFVLLLAIPVVAWLVLAQLAQRRIRAFDDQLPDLLAALASSLRAGHGFLQSLQAVAADAPSPAGEELRQALAETRLGRPVEEALAAVARRLPSKDFSYVLTAIAVQRQVGGSLAGLFETVTETVRQRQQFARKVRALTASGRTSAYSLVALPFVVAVLLTLANHSYLAPMFGSSTGRLMLMFGAVSLIIGTVLVRRIVSFKG